MNIEIANKLVELRKNHELSQEELAEKLGISRQAISKWERAESSPDTDNLIALAKLYDISLDELLLNKEKKVDNTPIDNIEGEVIDSEKEILEQNNESKFNVKFMIGIQSIVPLFIIVAYLVIGFLWGLWHPGWIIFLYIPIIESLLECIKYKTISKFEYPVFVASIYLLFSDIYGLYGKLWVIFLTIPIIKNILCDSVSYFNICSILRNISSVFCEFM